MALRTERALLRAVCAQQRHCERGGAERLQGAEQGRNTGRDREATGRKAAKKQKQGKADGGGAFAGAMEKAPVFEEGGLLQIEGKNIFKYSTNETFTGSVWLDGKKIYRRVYKIL